jgi:hypothetical protein
MSINKSYNTLEEWKASFTHHCALKINHNMEQVLNPFGYGQATRVIDENRKTVESWVEYLTTSKVFDENEFYVLFEDGLLVKKGRSKFRSSQYLSGGKFKPFHEQQA